jgi:hypothetical protein
LLGHAAATIAAAPVVRASGARVMAAGAAGGEYWGPVHPLRFEMKASATTALAITQVLGLALAAPAAAKPIERRLHSDTVEASSFLWNDWNKFVENYHPNYVADDDPATAWVEGAKGSGAGEWIKIQVTPLEQTTKVRLRVRNGYQKSKDLWKANARAKAVTVRLLPSKVEKQVTLADTDGWQEIAVDQPSGQLKEIELAVGSVYEGAKYADLCISDVQVFVTSETPDNPAFEKSKRANLMAWRSARIAAAKVFASKKVELPIYPAYEVKETPAPKDTLPMDRAGLLAEAAKDPVFAKEWKDALAAAAALEGNLAAMTRAQIAPTSQTKLVEADGLNITSIEQIAGSFGAPFIQADAIRLPMLGLVSAMFADQLRVLDVKDAQTIEQYEKAQKSCTPAAWVARAQPKEGGPQRVTALAIGRCERLEGRGGAYLGRTVELMVYDPSGKLVLVAGEGHVEGYRWTTDGGKPMLAGGRSLTWEGILIEAKRRAAVAAK